MFNPFRVVTLIVKNKPHSNIIRVFSRSKWNLLKFLEPKTDKTKELVDQMQKGFSSDYREVIHDLSGKLFAINDKVIPKMKSTPFPEMLTTSLQSQKIKLPSIFDPSIPTLVSVTMKPYVGFDMVDSWRIPFEKEFPYPSYQVLTLTNVIYKIILPFALRSTTPKERKDKFLIHSQKFRLFEVNTTYNILGLKNSLLGYVFIVHGGLIRWRGVGTANSQDIEKMKKVVRDLEKKQIKFRNSDDNNNNENDIEEETQEPLPNTPPANPHYQPSPKSEKEK